MDSTTLTNFWWQKDKNGIDFLSGNLNTTTKVMVIPNNDKESERDPNCLLCLGPREIEEDTLS